MRNEGIMISTNRKLLALVLLLLSASFAIAQTHRAAMRGTVLDPNGAAIPGAQIRLTNLATNEVRSVVSDSEGQYVIPSLTPGTYDLQVEVTSFQRHNERVEILVNQQPRLDITMQVKGPDEGGIDAVVETLIKKDSVSAGAVIENRQVVGLPLDGRNFYELSLLVPGAAPAAPGSAGSVRGDFAFSVNGARED